MDVFNYFNHRDHLLDCLEIRKGFSGLTQQTKQTMKEITEALEKFTDKISPKEGYHEAMEDLLHLLSLVAENAWNDASHKLVNNHKEGFADYWKQFTDTLRP